MNFNPYCSHTLSGPDQWAGNQPLDTYLHLQESLIRNLEAQVQRPAASPSASSEARFTRWWKQASVFCCSLLSFRRQRS